MSLDIKSEENKQAFLMLKEKQFFRDDDEKPGFRSPAIHCCYYSCFQKVLYILKEYYPDQYEQGSKIGHGQQIKTFTNCIGKVIERTQLFELNTILKELKDLRLRADYHDELSSKEELIKAEERLKSFHDIIRRELET